MTRDGFRRACVVVISCATLAVLVLAIRRMPEAKPITVGSSLTLNGRAMGTTYSITCASGMGQMAEPTVEELKDAVEKELTRIERLMSTYDVESEVSRFNASTSTDWFLISEDTFRVLEKAESISKLSSGKFDVTVHSLVKAWGFGADLAPKKTPTKEELGELLQHVGYLKLTLRTEGPAIRKDDADLEIDLSAIAKGYAADRVSEVLRKLGVENHLVEIGGEIVVSGRRSAQSAWRVGIESPIAGIQQIKTRVELPSGAIATSGDYRNAYMLEGRRISHIIDPQTGAPVDDVLASVSVVAEDCMTADAWATALLASGHEQARRLAESEHLAALFITRDGSGFRVDASSEFQSRFPEALR